VAGPLLVAGSETVEIKTDTDLVRVRQAVRASAVAARLSLLDQTKVVTAASELARNVVVHGGGGMVTVEAVSDGQREGLRVVFVDSGPGIAEIEDALLEGWSTAGGLGLGLPGARRLVDRFLLQSEPGAGTRVEVTKWRR
jgi:serine/threonine-protein kinase RsbT